MKFRLFFGPWRFIIGLFSKNYSLKTIIEALDGVFNLSGTKVRGEITSTNKPIQRYQWFFMWPFLRFNNHETR